jgi:hypothetical protein
MDLRSAVWSSWLEGRLGLRSVLFATVLLGSLGAALDAVGAPRPAIVIAIVALALPVDLACRLLKRNTRFPTNGAGEVKEQRRTEQAKTLVANASR